MQTTSRLAELISNKRQILVQLREIGERQNDVVTGGDISTLLKLLSTKQQLISALQALETQLKPYYGEDPDHRHWNSAEERAHCAQQAAECNALLEQVVRLEKLGAEKLTLRRNEVAEQLQQVHAAAHVRSAYEAQRWNHAALP
jgi:hypothetical protein